MTVAMYAHGIAPVSRLPATRRSTTSHTPSSQTSAFVGKALTKKVHTGCRQKYLGLKVQAVVTLPSPGLSPSEAFKNFTRPHTILGTIVSTSSVTLMAWQFGHVFELFSVFIAAKQWATAVAAAVLMNVAIVGINQVYDKKLDRVNKPYLPMASGVFSSDIALSVIAVSTAGSFAIGIWSGSSALMWALVISLMLGIVYSVDYPGLRWKKSPLLAATCVLFVRAVIVQLGFFAHALGRQLTDFNFPPNLWCAIGFMTVYGIVIALFKDLPDIEGDIKQNVRTLSVRLGPVFVFNLCLALLTAAYGTAVFMSVANASSTMSLVMGAIHFGVIATLLMGAQRVDVSSSESLYDYYIKYIWKAFYLEYFLLPFISFV